MKTIVPKLTYHLSNPLLENYRAIEVNGEIIHWIENPDKFYEMFGYTQDMRKAGILPEEYIWNEFINHRKFDFSACLQTHIIEYLRVHSQKFMQKYGNQCERWLEELIAAAPGDDVCASCKIKPFCSN